MLKSDTPQNRLMFVVSAPSGTGKTSLCNRAVRELSGLTFSISHTTRPARTGEQDRKNYFFVAQQEFEKLVSEGKIAEWTEIYGNFYGTAKETVRDAFKNGFDILFDIDERGAEQLSQAYASVITILILPPSMKALKERLVNRATDTEDIVLTRLKKARGEIEKMSWYSYVIINDIFEDALTDLKAIIMAERCKNNHSHIEALLNE